MDWKTERLVCRATNSKAVPAKRSRSISRHFRRWQGIIDRGPFTGRQEPITEQHLHIGAPERQRDGKGARQRIDGWQCTDAGSDNYPWTTGSFRPGISPYCPVGGENCLPVGARKTCCKGGSNPDRALDLAQLRLQQQPQWQIHDHDPSRPESQMQAGAALPSWMGKRVLDKRRDKARRSPQGTLQIGEYVSFEPGKPGEGTDKQQHGHER